MLPNAGILVITRVPERGACKPEFQPVRKLILDISSPLDMLVRMKLHILYHNGGKI